VAPVTTNKQNVLMLFKNAHENSLNKSCVFLTFVIQHILSVVLVSRRHVLTSKSMTLGQWSTKEFCSGGSTNSVEDRENGDLGAVAPIQGFRREL